MQEIKYVINSVVSVQNDPITCFCYVFRGQINIQTQMNWSLYKHIAVDVVKQQKRHLYTSTQVKIDLDLVTC